MTDRTTAEPANQREATRTRDTDPGVLSASLAELRHNPWLFLPFLLAGLVVSAINAIHRIDPIPTRHVATILEGNIDVAFVGYPAGYRSSSLVLEPMLGLRLPYLLWGLGSYVLSLTVLSIAGVLVISRMVDVEPTIDTWVGFSVLVLAFDLVDRVLGSITALQELGLLFGIPILVIWFLVFIRLFATPGLVVQGRSLGGAVHYSRRISRGHSGGIFVLILVIGLGNAVLGAIPIAGTALSTTVIGTVHATVVGVFVRQTSPVSTRS